MKMATKDTAHSWANVVPLRSCAAFEPVQPARNQPITLTLGRACFCKNGQLKVGSTTMRRDFVLFQIADLLTSLALGGTDFEYVKPPCSHLEVQPAPYKLIPLPL